MLRYLGRVRGEFAVSLVLLLLVGGLTSAKAWLIQPVFDHFRRQGATGRDLLGACLAIALLFGLQAALTFAYAWTARRMGARLVRAIREDLFDHVLRQGVAGCSARGSGDLTSRIVNDALAVEGAAVDSLQGLVRDAVTLVLLFGVLLWYSPRLALVCLAVLAAAGLLLRRMNRRVRRLSVRVQERLAAISSRLGELIAGLEVVLAFGIAPRWRDRFRRANAEHYDAIAHLQTANAAAVAAIQAILGIGLALLFFLTGRALLRGEITEGQFLSFLGTMYLMQAPAVGIGQKLAQVTRGLAAGCRALELLDDAPAEDEPACPVPLPDRPLGLALRGATFSYGGKPVLRDAWLEAAPEELTVLTGGSGTGKTTVARLLLRFLPAVPETVLVGGIPVERLSRKELSRAVSYVSQEVFLFDGTLRSNLTLARPDASGEEIAEVLRLCCLDGFAAELPLGLDTPVGERGGRLSGGQRQRIAIARALLAHPRVLLLDEATSALDPALEQRLLRNLVETPPRRTILAITHRPGVVACADRVLVLDEGRLTETDAAGWWEPALPAARGGAG